MTRLREGLVIADKYRLERPLARGGMGSIWVARHLTLDMAVAIKFMDPNFAETAEGRSRFEREARAIALIQSPNIVHVHDYGIFDEVPYMAMELLRGEDLGTRIRREQRLALPVVADVVTQVAKALRKAHEAGIIHRDLKPANVYLARDEDEQIVKVLDFGVAKVIGPGEASESTRTGVVVGSVHYMSPEQARGLKDVDHRSDLWSLGVIAFRALAGQLPFPGDQMGDVIVKICSDPVPPISSLRPDLGPDADAFFARVFARRPDERFQSARELAQAFAAIRGAEAAYAPPPSVGAPSSNAPTGAIAPVTVSAITAAPTLAPQSSPSGFSHDPAPTPPVAPLQQLPPIAGTLTTASQVSDIHVPMRRGPSSAVVMATVVACAAVLGIGGVLLFHRAGSDTTGAAAAPPSGAAAVTATATATAAATAPPAPSAAPSATAEGAATAESTAAPAPSTSSSASKASTQKGVQPGKGGKKINSELGF
jgi:serine/threonine-protein kinase